MALSKEGAAATAKQGVRLDVEVIPPEILAVIAAAATAFLGTSLRIGSAQLLHSPQGAVSRWTRQGRVSVLASHNLRSKR